MFDILFVTLTKLCHLSTVKTWKLRLCVFSNINFTEIEQKTTNHVQNSCKNTVIFTMWTPEITIFILGLVTLYVNTLCYTLY